MSYSVIALSFVIAFSVIASSELRGQDEELDDVEEKVRKLVVSEFEELVRAHLMAIVDDVARLIEVEPAELAKLRVAAKGAASRYAAKHSQSVEKKVRFNNVDENCWFEVGDEQVLREPGQDKTDEFRVTFHVGISERIVTVRQQRRNGSSSSGFAGGIREIRQEKIWKKALGAVLSKEQFERFEKKSKAEQEARRQTAIRLSIAAALSRQQAVVRFTDEQKQKLQQLIEDRVKNKTVTLANLEWTVRSWLRELPADDVRQILSETQHTRWRGAYQ